MAQARKPEAARMPTINRPEMLRRGSDTDFRVFIHDTLAFAARILEVRNGFGAILGLSGSQYSILISIGRLQGKDGVGVNAIADHLHLSGAFVTIEVNRLVALGFVDKASDPDDGRRVRLKITDEGSRKLATLLPVQAPVNDALFASLSRSEFDAFRKIMARLVTNGDEALALLDFYAAKNGTRV
jgi:DNA-binding MarR family transcriptional regulator